MLTMVGTLMNQILYSKAYMFAWLHVKKDGWKVANLSLGLMGVF